MDTLCPVKTLELYEEKTAHLREDREESGSQLVISFKKPHNPVKSASFSRWIKSDAGVDTAQRLQLLKTVPFIRENVPVTALETVFLLSRLLTLPATRLIPYSYH